MFQRPDNLSSEVDVNNRKFSKVLKDNEKSANFLLILADQDVSEGRPFS